MSRFNYKRISFTRNFYSYSECSRLMYEMFPVSGIKYSPVRYSNNLNKLIIQDNLLRHNYFSKDIPM